MRRMFLIFISSQFNASYLLALSQDRSQGLAVGLCLALVIRRDLLGSKSQKYSLPVVIKLENQRTILVDAVRVAGQTTLVHVDIVNTRAIRRAPDISSSLLVDSVLDNRVQLVQDILVGVAVVVGHDLSVLDGQKVLGADEVQALEGGLGAADVAAGVVMTVVVVAVAVAVALRVLILGVRAGAGALRGKVKAQVQLGELLGDGVGEVTVLPVDETGVLVCGFDVDSGLETLA